MIERDPDFEDDKVRFWIRDPGPRAAGEHEHDPTVMTLDQEREEIFETRAYRFRLEPGAVSYIVGTLLSENPDFETNPAQLFEAAAEWMKDTRFKFLAKRRKEDGDISYMLVVATPGHRRLMARLDQVGESGYRQVVEVFEEHFLGTRRILTPPLVVSLEEWRRYSQRGSS